MVTREEPQKAPRSLTASLEDELYAVLQAIGHAGSPHTISVHCITSGQLYERPEVPIAHDVHLTYERALQLPDSSPYPKM